MKLTKHANKTQGGEANPSKFGLQNMIFSTKNTLKFSAKKPKKDSLKVGNKSEKALKTRNKKR